jgi:hypothetical protein
MPFQSKTSALVPPPITLNEPLSLKRIWPIDDCVIAPSVGSMLGFEVPDVESISVLRVKVSVTGMRAALGVDDVDRGNRGVGAGAVLRDFEVGPAVAARVAGVSPMNRLRSASCLSAATRRMLPSAVSSPGRLVAVDRAVDEGQQASIVVPSAAAP